VERYAKPIFSMALRWTAAAIAGSVIAKLPQMMILGSPVYEASQAGGG
jgi:hypothetical protein